MYPSAFLRMIRQFQHTKLMKMAGKGNIADRIRTTKPGELAVLFLYYLTLALDANFRLKNRNRSSDVADPGLHTGLAYFVPNDPYKDHILKFATQNDISMCSGFKSLVHAETKFSTGLRVTGVGLCLCARHEFVCPIGVGDLQKGERYCNMDYIFFSSLLPVLFLSVVVSYDITCQWKINLFKRMEQLPELLWLPLALATSSFLFGIPKFHAPAHAAACATPHSLNLMPGVGRTDEMGPGQDTIASTITLAITTGESVLLRQRYILALSECERHQIALEEFNLSVDAAHREEWTKMIEDWDAVKSNPNPYIATKTLKRKYMPSSQMRKERPPPEASPVVIKLAQAPSQCLASDIKNKTALSANQHTNVQQRRAALHHQIHNFHSIQAVYMVDIEDITNRNLDDLDAKPEEITLWLPSTLQPATRTAICMNDISIVEEKLREAQCHDALIQLQNYLHTKSHCVKYRNLHICGQRANTCAHALIDSLLHKIDCAAWKYRVAHAVLLSLRGPGSWERELRTLQAKDICGPNATTSGDIDDANIPSTQATLRIEWAKARARGARWTEEVVLLKEEMHHMRKFLQWRAEWWQEQCQPLPTIKFVIPGSSGKLPTDIGMPSGGSLTTDQWLLLSTIYGPIIIPQLWAACLPKDVDEEVLRHCVAVVEKMEVKKQEEANHKAINKQAIEDAKKLGKEAVTTEQARIARENVALAEAKKQEKVQQMAAKQADKARLATEKKARNAELKVRISI
ncbi:hypothetical protein PAXINDRAFT_11826 [Paxillus involutus ATCC 200175]|uniref:CxC2-like cysteine cluster KDZ transposase-associated domain-containing protein n=1 Tax=Paxillus involutus ATCC 200175 TaxID=664439 RepID=A0A0C9TYB1_PAXIN|nr:hypothetical protein PAXINDRAFT_11826 [Paxillus involutus ATCC 200175]